MENNFIIIDSATKPEIRKRAIKLIASGIQSQEQINKNTFKYLFALDKMKA